MEIYLDENLSEYVADALNSLSKGYFKDVLIFSTKTKFGKGMPDESHYPWHGRIRRYIDNQRYHYKFSNMLL